MLRLNSRQLSALGSTMRELANYAAAALVFGQFIGAGSLSWAIVAAGTLFWFVVVWAGLLLEGQ